MDSNDNYTWQAPRAFSARTQQDDLWNWRRWARHCAALAELRGEVIDPLNAPFWVFEALFTVCSKNGAPLSAWAIRKIAQSVVRRYGNVVPAHKKPEHAADWWRLPQGEGEAGAAASPGAAGPRRDAWFSPAEVQRITGPDMLATLLRCKRAMEARSPSLAEARQAIGHQQVEVAARYFPAADPSDHDS